MENYKIKYPLISKADIERYKIPTSMQMRDSSTTTETQCSKQRKSFTIRAILISVVLITIITIVSAALIWRYSRDMDSDFNKLIIPLIGTISTAFVAVTGAITAAAISANSSSETLESQNKNFMASLSNENNINKDRFTFEYLQYIETAFSNLRNSSNSKVLDFQSLYENIHITVKTGILSTEFFDLGRLRATQIITAANEKLDGTQINSNAFLNMLEHIKDFTPNNEKYRLLDCTIKNANISNLSYERLSFGKSEFQNCKINGWRLTDSDIYTTKATGENNKFDIEILSDTINNIGFSPENIVEPKIDRFILQPVLDRHYEGFIDGHKKFSEVRDSQRSNVVIREVRNHLIDFDFLSYDIKMKYSDKNLISGFEAIIDSNLRFMRVGNYTEYQNDWEFSFSECIFYNSYIYIEGKFWPKFKNCIFINTKIHFRGERFLEYQSSIEFKDCIFINNTSKLPVPQRDKNYRETLKKFFNIDSYDSILQNLFETNRGFVVNQIVTRVLRNKISLNKIEHLHE